MVDRESIKSELPPLMSSIVLLWKENDARINHKETSASKFSFLK